MTYYVPYRNKEGIYQSGLTEQQKINLQDKYSIILDQNYYSKVPPWKRGDILNEITLAWLSANPHYK